jgi:hypothetical protein
MCGGCVGEGDPSWRDRLTQDKDLKHIDKKGPHPPLPHSTTCTTPLPRGILMFTNSRPQTYSNMLSDVFVSFVSFVWVQA